MTYLLFDLGNVLVELRGLPWLRLHWPGCDDAEIHRRWLNLPLIHDYESGRCTPESFFARMPAALGADLTPAQFQTLFDAWVVGPYDGAEALLAPLRGRYRLGCLSNTNASHMAKLRRESSLLSVFDHCFFSHELGCMKPDPAIYRQVQEKLGLPPAEILFFDDSAANCAAAADLGWQTRCVFGLPAVEAALLACV